jgi:hypothetical protein
MKPSRANRCAVAAPIPFSLPQPVMSATRCMDSAILSPPKDLSKTVELAPFLPPS